ncbi:hypothetical protein Aca07nite_65170 [Actinoplanes capillaceus]|uniref:Uncharacterized protein n=1 Tax=Actinoplanes campanulatus TaxID=113559 RepID=A0ABQ3WSM1_9ACTN|nr:hypothetical protein [Actinoplanes capillaceus]GID49242.1 hypothetical protein Aca07nite_65170 [Actinoplanes capillaceus]
MNRPYARTASTTAGDAAAAKNRPSVRFRTPVVIATARRRGTDPHHGRTTGVTLATTSAATA